MATRVTMNLFPWREEVRRRMVRHVVWIVCIGVGVALLFACSVVVYLHHEVIKHQKTQRFYSKALANIDASLSTIKALYHAKKRSLKKIAYLQEEKKHQYELMCHLACVAAEMPIGVYLTHINAKESLITIQGKSVDTDVLSVYQDHLVSHCAVRDANLQLLSSDQDEKVYKEAFSIELNEESASW